MSAIPLPEGPSSPAWEQAKAWIESPLEFWRDCQRDYGDIFTVQLGSLGATVLFADPAAVQQVFALGREQVCCGDYNQHYGVLMGSTSLLVLDGERHWAQRRILAPNFTPSSTVHWIEQLRRLIAEHAGELTAGATFSPRRWVHAIVMEQMLQLLFGAGHRDLAALLRNVMLKEVSKDYGTWSPWARFTKWHPIFRRQIAASIATTRNHPEAASGPDVAADDSTVDTDRRSLFDRLVAWRGERGDMLDVAQIQDHLFTMILAGVDPTLLATTWALHWVCNDLELMQRLRGEMPEEAGVSKWIQESDLLEGTVREVLRMVPVVTTPSGRKLARDARILDRDFPAGTTLLPCTYLVHHRASLYPEPERFRPDRFLERTYKSYEYFPFGGGQRVCIGARLAQVVMKTILAELLGRFDLEPVNADAVVPVRHGTLLAPSDNWQLRVGMRRKAASVPE